MKLQLTLSLKLFGHELRFHETSAYAKVFGHDLRFHETSAYTLVRQMGNGGENFWILISHQTSIHLCIGLWRMGIPSNLKSAETYLPDVLSQLSSHQT